MAKDTKTTYIEAVGRRKEAVARVRISLDSKMRFDVNGRDLSSYFPVKELMETVESPFKTTPQAFSVSARLKGGGIAAQAQALRHGIARALNKYDASLRAPLKSAGYLTRDARKKERKKFGLKKARKAAQWSKR
jgi:small subunit ribosomal protein S9